MQKTAYAKINACTLSTCYWFLTTSMWKYILTVLVRIKKIWSCSQILRHWFERLLPYWKYWWNKCLWQYASNTFWYQYASLVSTCSGSVFKPFNKQWLNLVIYIYILKLQWLHSEGWFLEMHAQPVINNFYCSTHLHLKVYIWIFMSNTHNYSFSFQHCDIIIHPFLFALVILCAYPFKWLDKLLLH